MNFKDVYVLGNKAHWDQDSPHSCMVSVFPFEIFFKKEIAGLYGPLTGFPGVQSGQNGIGDYEWTITLSNRFSFTRSKVIHNHFNETLELAVKDAELFVARCLAELGDNISIAKKITVISDVHDS